MYTYALHEYIYSYTVHPHTHSHNAYNNTVIHYTHSGMRGRGFRNTLGNTNLAKYTSTHTPSTILTVI